MLSNDAKLTHQFSGADNSNSLAYKYIFGAVIFPFSQEFYNSSVVCL